MVTAQHGGLEAAGAAYRLRLTGWQSDIGWHRTWPGVGSLDQHLHRSRDWLIRHNPVVMAVVLAAVGALFITEATQILTD